MAKRMGQQGFTALEIGLVVLVVILAGLAAYLVYHGNQVTKTAGVTPSAAPSVSMRPSAPATPRCHTADLSLSLGNSNAAAGTSYTALIFTNKSGHTCTLSGYPGLSSVSASGSQVGKAAERSSAASVSLVTLASGQAAHATFGHASDTSASNPGCSTQAASLKVYPPDETSALTVAYQGCPVNSVYPVTSGTDPTI